jgi:hypothetical protein
MPGLSASQEMQLEYLTCHAPELPPIAIRRRAMEGIHQEVSEAFTAAPHRGAETGGILLGRREEDRIVVEDFEPVPSEHRFGPSYRLSDTDCELLQETLEWFRGGAQPGLSVLGFYRGHTLPEVELCQEDEDLMRAYFRECEDLVLLVKPSLMETSETNFFIRRCGGGAQPVHQPPVMEQPSPVDAPPSPDPPSSLAPPPLMTWPPPRPRTSLPDVEADRSAGTGRRRRWPWYVGAMLFGLVAGALGYLWWHPDAGVERIAPTAVALPAPQPAAPPVVEGTPAPLEPDKAGTQALLERWAAALKRGDVDAAAKCYAPVVTTYYARHDVTRDAVRQSIQRDRARYGRLDVYRVSGVSTTPVSDSRAVVTFRKHWHWQASGRGRPAGEEEERMTLVRTQGAWQISSEQATR